MNSLLLGTSFEWLGNQQTISMHTQALEGLKHLASKSVNLVFANAPTQDKLFHTTNAKVFANKHSYFNWAKQWIDELMRVLTDDGCMYLTLHIKYLPLVEQYLNSKYFIVSKFIWDKRTNQNLDNQQDFAQASSLEQIWIQKEQETNGTKTSPTKLALQDLANVSLDSFHRGRLQYILLVTKSKDSNFTFNHQVLEKSTYVTQHSLIWKFPLVTGKQPQAEFTREQTSQQMLELIIKLSSKKGDLVLDPFASAYTTGKVALDLKRKFIGIEERLDHYLIGLRRLELTKNYKGIWLNKRLSNKTLLNALEQKGLLNLVPQATIDKINELYAKWEKEHWQQFNKYLANLDKDPEEAVIDFARELYAEQDIALNSDKQPKALQTEQEIFFSQSLFDEWDQEYHKLNITSLEYALQAEQEFNSQEFDATNNIFDSNNTNDNHFDELENKSNNQEPLDLITKIRLQQEQIQKANSTDTQTNLEEDFKLTNKEIILPASNVYSNQTQDQQSFFQELVVVDDKEQGLTNSAVLKPIAFFDWEENHELDFDQYQQLIEQNKVIYERQAPAKLAKKFDLDINHFEHDYDEQTCNTDLDNLQDDFNLSPKQQYQLSWWQLTQDYKITLLDNLASLSKNSHTNVFSALADFRLKKLQQQVLRETFGDKAFNSLSTNNQAKPVAQENTNLWPWSNSQTRHINSIKPKVEFFEYKQKLQDINTPTQQEQIVAHNEHSQSVTTDSNHLYANQKMANKKQLHIKENCEQNNEQNSKQKIKVISYKATNLIGGDLDDEIIIEQTIYDKPTRLIRKTTNKSTQ